MAGDVQINLDPGLEKKLHQFPIVTSKVQAAAVLIQAQAKADAPVDTGAYRDGIVVEKSRNFAKSGAYIVKATDPKSSWVEFGNKTHQALYVIRNAVLAAGFRLRGKKNG